MLFKKNALPADLESTLISEEAAEPSPGAANGLIETIYRIMLVVTVGGWAVFGFVVWVPLLVRATIILARAVFHASLFRDEARIANARLFVHFAVGFYMRGFEHFIDFYRQRMAGHPPTGLFESLTAMTAKHLLVECSWAVGVWVAAYYSVRALFALL